MIFSGGNISNFEEAKIRNLQQTAGACRRSVARRSHGNNAHTLLYCACVPRLPGMKNISLFYILIINVCKGPPAFLSIGYASFQAGPLPHFIGDIWLSLAKISILSREYWIL
jgi:hypothetical protein